MQVLFCFLFPGCPPLQGSEGSQQNIMGVLETAMKIANQNADAEDGDSEAAKVEERKVKAPHGQTFIAQPGNLMEMLCI